MEKPRNKVVIGGYLPHHKKIQRYERTDPHRHIPFVQTAPLLSRAEALVAKAVFIVFVVTVLVLLSW
jgi:hypothetical protein